MGLSPYEKKNYKESKRRRKQALLADETGYIKPYRKSKRRLALIIISSAAAVLLISGAVLFRNITHKQSGDEVIELNRTAEEELLTVVNSQHPLESGYVPDLEDFRGYKINLLALNSVKELFDEAEKKGIELKLNSAYISYSDQQLLYENALSQFLSNPDYTEVRAEAAARKLVPEAGCSEAQTGLLLDFEIPDSATADFLERSSVKCGFILRYPENKEDFTHTLPSNTIYRYVGAENAMKLRSYNMCLEEYVEYLNTDN